MVRIELTGIENFRECSDWGNMPVTTFHPGRGRTEIGEWIPVQRAGSFEKVLVKRSGTKLMVWKPEKKESKVLSEAEELKCAPAPRKRGGAKTAVPFGMSAAKRMTEELQSSAERAWKATRERAVEILAQVRATQ